jgi:hypothetical protein
MSFKSNILPEQAGNFTKNISHVKSKKIKDTIKKGQFFLRANYFI